MHLKCPKMNNVDNHISNFKISYIPEMMEKERYLSIVEGKIIVGDLSDFVDGRIKMMQLKVILREKCAV